MPSTQANDERSPEVLIAQARVIAEFHAVLAAHERRDVALGTLLLGARKRGVNTIPGAEPDRLFRSDEIQERCRLYRLRFIEASAYKGVLPPRAVHAIGRLEERTGYPVRGLRMLTVGTGARSHNGPCRLLAPLGGGQYYLVHEWGGVPGGWRRRLVWPLRSAREAFITVAMVATLLALVLPASWVGIAPGQAYWGEHRAWMLLWCQLMCMGAASFAWLALGGRFNGHNWSLRNTV